MRVVVLGSWQNDKATASKKECEILGKFLAEHGHTLVSGAGEGISELVVNSYRNNGGKKYVAIIPSDSEMKKLGEELGPKPDEIIKTKLDYPQRNLKLIKSADAIIAINGGLGTLTEIINAIYDYKKKVAIIDVGELPKWVKAISTLDGKYLLTSDVEKAVEYLEKN